MENYARKTSTGQSRKTNWRDSQVLKVHGKVGKEGLHRTVKKDKMARQSGIEGKWKSRQERLA